MKTVYVVLIVSLHWATLLTASPTYLFLRGVEDGSGRVGDEPEEPELPAAVPTLPNVPKTGYALYPELFQTVEAVTKKQWDQTKFLENLSGYETNCNMLAEGKWSYKIAHQVAKDNKVTVEGLFSSARDVGDLDMALVKAINNLGPKLDKVKSKKEVGCSVATDCYFGRGDITSNYVVVSCLFS